MYHSEGGVRSATLLGVVHSAFSHRFNDALVQLILYN